ncbi:hypothetical protein [Planctobacterium marinum]|uniref:hypothetical protein n=1 Tax=Planctobacterium marinum TaxID=1631968 RepID=UPI001E601947|nr:hypothetical protein [Planctobacterium marinum]MCC2605865.1 hypothetical protein [Planctobacterium marinum]
MSTQKPQVFQVQGKSEPPTFRGAQSFLSGVSEIDTVQTEAQNKEICELHEKLILLINELEELLIEDQENA